MRDVSDMETVGRRFSHDWPRVFALTIDRRVLADDQVALCRHHRSQVRCGAQRYAPRMRDSPARRRR